MSVRRHISFGSTPNWRNCYAEVKAAQDSAGRLAYANYDPSLGIPPTDEQKELLQSYQPVMPTILFKGSEKLHGENMAVCYSQGEIWVQGRNHIRTVLGDQNGMAAFVEKTKRRWDHIFEELAQVYRINTYEYTIVIDCEWAGGNIQKGNAACSGADKGAYIFDYFRVVNNDTDERQAYSTAGLTVFPEDSIYLMSSFGSYELLLDFNNPEECEQLLNNLVKDIEDNSPIAHYFNKPENVGEGLYLYGSDGNCTYRLKAKGEKHGGKPKEPRKPKQATSPEEVEKLTAIADKVTPTWRLTQAITEVNATEPKHLGEVIKWVIADIAKEELPVLIEADVELKNLSRYISAIVKAYYFDSIKGY